MNIAQLLTKLKALIYSKSETDSLLGGKANSSHTHTKSQITDFPSLSTVATSGSYSDLSNKPTIPTNTNQLTNGSGYLSGTVGIANGGTGATTRLEAAKNLTNENVGTNTQYFFTLTENWGKVGYASVADAKSVLSVPSKTSQLTNDSSFITSAGSCSYSTTSGTSTYSTYLKSLGSQTPKSGRDIFHSGVYTYTTYTDTNTPAHYGAVIGYGNGQSGSCEMFAEWFGRGNLWFRVLRDCEDSWTNWQRIITSDNIGSQSVNYATSAGSAGSASSATYAGYVKGNRATGRYVNEVKYGNALVTTNQTTFGAIWNAPTKNYRVACAVYTNTNDDVYLCYSVSNANVSSSTNSVSRECVWNANDGTLRTTNIQASNGLYYNSYRIYVG